MSKEEFNAKMKRINEIEKVFSQFAPDSKIITVQAGYSEWELINVEIEGTKTEAFVRTMFRIQSNFVQLIFVDQILKRNAITFLIYEFEIEKEFNHNNYDKWINLEPEERNVNESYLNQPDLIALFIAKREENLKKNENKSNFNNWLHKNDWKKKRGL